MSDFDAGRIAALAHRLGIEPRQLVLVAARLAQAPATDVGVALAAARAPTGRARHLADLMATPRFGFAQDDVDRALAAVRPREA